MEGGGGFNLMCETWNRGPDLLDTQPLISLPLFMSAFSGPFGLGGVILPFGGKCRPGQGLKEGSELFKTGIIMTRHITDYHSPRVKDPKHALLQPRAPIDQKLGNESADAGPRGTAGLSHVYRPTAKDIVQCFADLAIPEKEVKLRGDSGYQLQPWIVTPVRNPVTEGEAAYNRAHIWTRGIIERIFGILKSRFRCLDRSGGALLYSPCKVCKVVVVCCILHNIAIRAGVRLGEQEAEGEGDSDSDEEEPNAPLGEVRPERGRDVRAEHNQKLFGVICEHSCLGNWLSG
ncbi:hypothetical protein SKAU_G00192470 [Synaphobranchus kaupii]|uniref:DDE Tnp4 domain-containing protein n=1 Tax=Synaphobranchus kaupii TaxID=118154 RepID=A0A9Q1IXE7_SYNKA|nr:hypothetical protein SKAU_G00192470 [Synaphobranchus kaupii]